MSLSGVLGASSSLYSMQAMQSQGRPQPPSFDQIDSDSSGGISLDEFKAAGPKGGSDARATELFNKIDSDQDGTISKDEDSAFKEKMQSRMQSMMMQAQSFGSQGAVDMFANADSDGDGSVTKAEFNAAAPPKPPGASADTSASDDLFSQIDTDGDGSITREEDDAFRSKMDEQRRSNSDNTSFSAALLQQATSAYSSSTDSTKQLLTTLLTALQSKTA